MSYRSRISVGVVLFMAVICFISFYVPIFEQKNYIVGILTPISIFSIFLLAFCSIRYVIDGQTLKIYYLWWIHQDIDIMSIRKMEPSHNLISSPAASLKRLAIYYNKYDDVLISPKNQEDFIKQLMQINPNIQYISDAK